MQQQHGIKWCNLMLFKYFSVTQVFLSDFTGDDSADLLCVPKSNNSRSLATGDKAGSFMVSTRPFIVSTMSCMVSTRLFMVSSRSFMVNTRSFILSSR